jgi:hypothetical protein
MKDFSKHLLSGVAFGLGVMAATHLMNDVFAMGVETGRLDYAGKWTRKEGNVLKFPFKENEKTVEPAPEETK